MKILVLNSGSSSQKSALFELDDSDTADPVSPVWEGKLEWDGNKENLVIRNSRGKELREQKEIPPEERQASVEIMLRNLWSGPRAALASPQEIEVVGHRIVHGGPKLTQPVVVDAQVKQTIAEVAAIAPLHNRAGLQGIELIENLYPSGRQIAVFDTGFHRTLPPYAAMYPGPYEWWDHDIRRYGFHGINHEYCGRRAAQMLGRDVASLNIVSCHLGNGCSLAAIDGGKSVDTTMGFTPLDGIMMGTRGGSIDPGILLHLIRAHRTDADELDNLLNRKSGLLGISGVSSDMRDILAAARNGNPRTKLAFEIFVHRLQSGIGAMAASLGGLDVLIFTAGIGENSAEVRDATCARLGFLGIKIDETNNQSAKPDTDISCADSHVRVLVIRAQEDWAIARECLRFGDKTGPPRY